LASIVSFELFLPLPTAAKAAAEGALIAAAAAALGAAFAGGRAADSGILIGATAAWAASAASIAWLLAARGREARAFWRAFGGGIALRGAVLALLAVWGARRAGVSLDWLLLTYAFVLTALQLTLDYRHLRLR
jgi:hypothetical protein